MTDFESYEQSHPQMYQKMLASVRTSTAGQNKFFYSVAKKQSSWFGTKSVLLVIKQPLSHYGPFELFYQKRVNMDLHHDYRGAQEPVNRIPLINLKMIARVQKKLIVAFVDEKSKLSDITLHFQTLSVAQEWQLLLRDKKSQAKLTQKSYEDKQKLIDELFASINTLQAELSTKIEECNRLLDERTVLKQQNNQYRGYVRTLENELLLQKSQRIQQRQIGGKEHINLRQFADSRWRDQLVHYVEEVQEVLQQSQLLKDKEYKGRLNQLIDKLKTQIMLPQTHQRQGQKVDHGN